LTDHLDENVNAHDTHYMLPSENENIRIAEMYFQGKNSVYICYRITLTIYISRKL